MIFLQKHTLNINTFIWHWLISTISFWFSLIKKVAVDISSKYLLVLIPLLLVHHLNYYLCYPAQWLVFNILTCATLNLSFSIDGIKYSLEWSLFILISLNHIPENLNNHIMNISCVHTMYVSHVRGCVCVYICLCVCVCL